jgi:hypothetical protein
MKIKTIFFIIETALLAASLVLFFIVDWKLALGLLLYEINVSCAIIRYRYLEEGK